MLGVPGELPLLLGTGPGVREETRETVRDFDPLIGGERKRCKEKVKWDVPKEDGGLHKYRKQKESSRSAGCRGSAAETVKSEAFVTRGPTGAQLSQTRSQRLAQARTSDGHWAVRMTTVTTKSYSSQLGSVKAVLPLPRLQRVEPSGVGMDLDTIQGCASPLDHSPQKGRSELAHKGSLGHRRPPTRAALRALFSSVWAEDDHATTSDLEDEVARQPEPETDDADPPDGGGGGGWRHPPKHAVLVFPMQLLNANKMMRQSSPSPKPSPEPAPSPEPVIQFEDENQNPIEHDSDQFTIHQRTNKTTTVKIRPASDPDSEPSLDSLDRLSKRHSGPTVVSITLKDPLSRSCSLDEENNARNRLLHSVDSDLEGSYKGSMVITIGEPRPSQDTGTQMYGTLRGSKKNKSRERGSGSPRPSSEGPTQILIRPFNRNEVTLPEELDPIPAKSKSSESGSSLVYIRAPASPEPFPSCKSPGLGKSPPWSRTARHDEDAKENYDFRRMGEKASSVSSSLASRDSSKEGSPERSSDFGRRSSRRDGLVQTVQIQTWDRRSQVSSSPSPSRIRELLLSRPASIIGDGGEVERVQRRLRDAPSVSSRRSSPSGERYRPSAGYHLLHQQRAVLGQRENRPEWLGKIDLNKRKGIDWDNLGSPRRSSGGHSPELGLNYLPQAAEASPEGLLLLAPESPPGLGMQVQCPRVEEEEQEVTLQPLRQPEWVTIAHKRKQNSLIDWEAISGLRGESGSRRGSAGEPLPPDASHHIGVQVNFRKKGSRHETSGDPRRTASADRSSHPPSSPRPDRSPSGFERSYSNLEPASPRFASPADLASNPLDRSYSNLESSSGRSKVDLTSPYRASPTYRTVSPQPERPSKGERYATRSHVNRSSSQADRSSSNSDNSQAQERRASRIPSRGEGRKNAKDTSGGDTGLSKVRASRETNERGDRPWRSSTRVRSPSPPPSRRWSQTPDREVVIEDLPRSRPASPCRGTTAARGHQPRSSWKEPVRSSSGSKSRPVRGGAASPSSRSDPRSSNINPWPQQPSGGSRSQPALTSPTGGDPRCSELTVDVGCSEGEDAHGAKKRVRFLIEEGRRKKVLSVTPTTYTMFGMEHEAKANRAKGEAVPGPVRSGEAEEARSETVLPVDQENYELQAYKIINHIRQMSKERVKGPSREASPSPSRAPSPVRPPSGKASGRPPSPEPGSALESNRRKSGSGSQRVTPQQPHKRRSHLQQRGGSGSATPSPGRHASPLGSSDSTQSESCPETPSQAGGGGGGGDGWRVKGAGRKTPEWMRKALHKQKSPVDWENLGKAKKGDSVKSKDQSSRIPIKRYFFNASLTPNRS